MANPLERLLKPPYVQTEEARREKQSEQLNQLNSILCEISECCVPNSFHFPREQQLLAIDELVSALARSLIVQRRVATARAVKVRSASRWNHYKAVDRRWTSLNLCKRLEQLIQRALDHTPERPLEPLDRIATGKGELADLARKFFKVLPELRKGANPDTVPWEDFAPLFVRARAIQRGKGTGTKGVPYLEVKVKSAPGSQRLIAYAVFLEIEYEDARWARTYWQGVNTLMSWAYVNPLFVQQLGRFQVPYKTDFDAFQSEKRRKNDRERQRKSRSRKKLCA